MIADCSELPCSCCTDYCDNASGEYIIQMGQVCEGIGSEFEFYGAGVGTDCEYFQEGFDLSCADTGCQNCQMEGSSCLQSFDYGIDLLRMAVNTFGSVI
mgnify:CR=1 FL=1